MTATAARARKKQIDYDLLHFRVIHFIATADCTFNIQMHTIHKQSLSRMPMLLLNGSYISGDEYFLRLKKYRHVFIWFTKMNFELQPLSLLPSFLHSVF